MTLTLTMTLTMTLTLTPELTTPENEVCQFGVLGHMCRYDSQTVTARPHAVPTRLRRCAGRDACGEVIVVGQEREAKLAKERELLVVSLGEAIERQGTLTLARADA